MKALRRAWKRLAGSMTGGRREAGMAAEFESHIDMLTDENVRRGMSPAEARRAALLTFGGVEAAKESYRDQRGWPGIGALRQDVRYALRGMRRSPAFTAVALACLALGIGANTAIFSLLNAVMLRSLPVSDPGRLVFFHYGRGTADISAVRGTTSGYGGFSLPYATYEAFRDRAKTLAGVFAFAGAGFGDEALTINVGGGRVLTGNGEMVTGGYFAVLGVSPVLGRAIVDADLAAGASAVAVVSQAFWMRELNAENSAIGRTIFVNGSPVTIVGIAPPGFAGLHGSVPDVWLPLRPTDDLRPWGSRARNGRSMFSDSRWWWCTIGARLKPGVTRSQALAETADLYVQSVTAGLRNIPRGLPKLTLADASPVFESLRRKLAAPLAILMATAALALLIACVNLAALLLGRARSRQKEIGVRLAIGASRARLVRQLLTESLLLSVAGGALGVLAARWGGQALLSLVMGAAPTPVNVSPDGTVLAFSAAVSIATGILFGLAPALTATRVDLALQLKQGARPALSRRTAARLLIGSQIALSAVLLFAAGLFVRTFRNLDGRQLGFSRENLLLFEIDPDRSGYKDAHGIALHSLLLQRIQNLPGVRSATFSEFALLSGWHNSSPSATDGAPLPPGQPDEAYFNRVGIRQAEARPGIRNRRRRAGRQVRPRAGRSSEDRLHLLRREVGPFPQHVLRRAHGQEPACTGRIRPRSDPRRRSESTAVPFEDPGAANRGSLGHGSDAGADCELLRRTGAAADRRRHLWHALLFGRATHG
jgi:macrolide transport system ATP-binding/permease protein